MAQPVIDTVGPVPAAPRQQLLVTGSNMGFVTSAFFDAGTDGHLYESAFTQVFDGEHVLVTVPPDLPSTSDGLSYTLVLVTIEDEVSVDHMGSFLVTSIPGAVTPPSPSDTPDPFPLPAPGESVGLDRIRARTRLELADPATPFQARVTGDGDTTVFDLPVRHVSLDTLIVTKIPAGQDPNAAMILTQGEDYTVDAFTGSITMMAPLADEDRLFVTGTRYRFFDNTTLDIFIETAFAQIARGRTITTETIGQFGYRQYSTFNYTYDTVPEVEILPMALLAKIEALWVLASDASYDIDIRADGASIPRSERYRQMMAQIQADTARFNDIAQQLNIGLGRIEMDTLRRVSRQTGRLVPVYVEKEYDDHSLPVRVLPGIDSGVGEGTTFVDPYYAAGSDFGGGFGP